MRPALLLAALALLAAALFLPGPRAARLLAGLAAAALLLLARLLRRPRRPPAPRRHVVIDGSNVMHWGGGPPDLRPVKAVIAELARQGCTPGVVFDANAGWKLHGRWIGEQGFARLLSLPEERVMVVPKGTQADGWILRAARDLGARIVTNDRYRDWARTYPEVTRPGHLIRGTWAEGRLHLGTDREPAAA